MPLIIPAKRQPYTIEEVATHNNEKSLWVIMNRKVYDLTAFSKRHPGGSAVLLQMAGKDATAAAAASHKSSLPAHIMWEYCVGHIVREKVPEKPKAREPPVRMLDELPDERALVRKGGPMSVFNYGLLTGYNEPVSYRPKELRQIHFYAPDAHGIDGEYISPGPGNHAAHEGDGTDGAGHRYSNSTAEAFDHLDDGYPTRQISSKDKRGSHTGQGHEVTDVKSDCENGFPNDPPRPCCTYSLPWLFGWTCSSAWS